MTLSLCHIFKVVFWNREWQDVRWGTHYLWKNTVSCSVVSGLGTLNTIWFLMHAFFLLSLFLISCECHIFLQTLLVQAALLKKTESHSSYMTYLLEDNMGEMVIQMCPHAQSEAFPDLSNLPCFAILTGPAILSFFSFAFSPVCLLLLLCLFGSLLLGRQ